MSWLINSFKMLPDAVKNNLIEKYIGSLTPKDKAKMAKDLAPIVMENFFEHMVKDDMKKLVKKLDEKQYAILKQLLKDE